MGSLNGFITGKRMDGKPLQVGMSRIRNCGCKSMNSGSDSKWSSGSGSRLTTEILSMNPWINLPVKVQKYYPGNSDDSGSVRRSRVVREAGKTLGPMGRKGGGVSLASQPRPPLLQKTERLPRIPEYHHRESHRGRWLRRAEPEW